jgi:ABC-type bacteriocin/lantibiotic exporter with double-glycine peptidase domain
MSGLTAQFSALASVMPESLKKLFYIVAGFRQRYVGMMVLGAVAVTIDTFAIIFFGALVADAMGAGEASQMVRRALAMIGVTDRTTMVVILMGVYLLKSVLLIMFTRSISQFALDMRTSLQKRLLKGVLTDIPYRNLAHMSSGEFTHKSMSVVHGFTMELILQGSLALVNAATGLMIFIYLLVMNPEPTLILTAAFGGIGVAYVRFFSRMLKDISFKLNNYYSRVFTLLADSIYAAKETRVHGLDQAYMKIVDDNISHVTREQVKLNTVHSIPRVIFELLLCLSFLVFTAGGGLDDGSPRDMMTQFSIFLIAGMRMFPASSQLLMAVGLFNVNFAAIDTIYKDLIDLDKAAAARKSGADGTRPIAADWKQISLRQVSMAYDADKPVLKQIDLDLDQGVVTGISGPSGGGKSTLLDILLGLLEPDAGSIRIGEQELSGCRTSWQAVIGYMSQNLFLLNDSVGDNLMFTDADKTLDQSWAMQCLRQAGLGDLATAEGLRFRIGERGSRLSGGQRQRLVFARLLYGRKSVLILDEPTASLDNAAEEAVIQCIQSLKKDRTVIVVSHSETLLRECDVIYEIRNGRATLAQDFLGAL